MLPLKVSLVGLMFDYLIIAPDRLRQASCLYYAARDLPRKAVGSAWSRSNTSPLLVHARPCRLFSDAFPTARIIEPQATHRIPDHDRLRLRSEKPQKFIAFVCLIEVGKIPAGSGSNHVWFVARGRIDVGEKVRSQAQMVGCDGRERGDD
jgi:hypothetical protein